MRASGGERVDVSQKFHLSLPAAFSLFNSPLYAIFYYCLMAEAEQMFMRALQGKEKACGTEQTSTLGTVNILGTFYAKQGKMAEVDFLFWSLFSRGLMGSFDSNDH
jgi:hypothetical protein